MEKKELFKEAINNFFNGQDFEDYIIEEGGSEVDIDWC